MSLGCVVLVIANWRGVNARTDVGYRLSCSLGLVACLRLAGCTRLAAVVRLRANFRFLSCACAI